MGRDPAGVEGGERVVGGERAAGGERVAGDAVGSGGAGGEPCAGERIAVGFVRALRGAGLTVPVQSTIAYVDALAAVGLGSRSAVYWAGRATLVCRPEDRGSYDRVWASYWLDRPPAPLFAPEAVPLTLAVDDAGDTPPPDESAADDEDREILAVRWSTAETLRDKDFADYRPDEWEQYSRLVHRLARRAESRPGRRRRPDSRRRGHPDLRRTVRRALRTDGIPIERAWRSPTPRPRKVVLLVDVSGSMESYARALVRFAHAAVVARGAGKVEVFTLGTRLTRVTRELSARDPDAALAAAARSVRDWSGGTRIGAGLREFNDRWGTRGLARGAVVVVLSDGWDRGSPDELAEEMGRLARVAHRVVWVNPLKASPGYAPLARGMAAALPYVDQFVEGHSVAALEHLAAVVAGETTDEGSPR